LLAALEQANAELREAYAIVEALSEHDGLTGIGNRRSFDAWFARAHEDARQSATPLALVLADVDDFKAYNDTYGHLAGDECLRLVAAILKETIVGTKAWLARYGGEEFAIILPGAGLDPARALAERLCAAVQACAVEHRHAQAGLVTISVGVASRVPGPGSTTDALFAVADEALYVAKREGRNRVASAA
jgi:diguanylate cyclase (GGDEF)-like protein